MAKKGKFQNPFPKLTRKLKGTNTVINAKSYSKVALGLTSAGLAYALVQETAKGITRTLLPGQSPNLEWKWTNSELGLAGQTLLFVSAASVSSSQLKNMGLLTRKEAQTASHAGLGLAVGRFLMGTSIGDVGKRFQYLLDGEVGAALFPGPGPAVTLPSNAAAAGQIVTSYAQNNGNPTALNVSDQWLQNRVVRGMPYKNEATNQTRAQIPDGHFVTSPPTMW
jgi:hypothetical protein